MLCRVNETERKSGEVTSASGLRPDRTTQTAPDREALYAELQPLVRRLIRQYGTSLDLRQDLASEIYCRFCNLLAAYDPESGVPLRPYLIRTLPAAVYSYMRVQWRLQTREVHILPELDEGPVFGEQDPTPEWDQALWLQGAVDALPAAIAQLPQRQRQVVVWRYYESRTFEEIAEELGVQPATARSLLRHGIHQLRRKMTLIGDARG